MSTLASQLESIVELLNSGDLKKVIEAIKKIGTVKKESFDKKAIDSLVLIVDSVIEITASKDILTVEEFIMKDCPLIPMLQVAADYCEESDDDERDYMNILISLYDILSFQGDFEASLKNTQKALEVANKSGVTEYIAEATMFCANAAISCALALASSVLEKCKPEETVEVPEDVEDAAINYINLIVDYSHEAYLSYIKLALEGAVELGLIDSSLVDKIDDDHILDTVTTLSTALDRAEKSEEVMAVINHLNLAVEMNEKCSDYDGTGMEELIKMVQDVCEGEDCECDDCECGEDCHCGHDHEEEKKSVKREKCCKEEGCCKGGCCKEGGCGDCCCASKKCKK